MPCFNCCGEGGVVEPFDEPVSPFEPDVVGEPPFDEDIGDLEPDVSSIP